MAEADWQALYRYRVAAARNIVHALWVDLRPLGQRVRAERTALGLTIRDLAARAGLSPRFLSDLEAGRGNISVRRLAAVGRALGLPLTALVAPLEAAQSPVIALVGLRGAGKSTIGRALGARLGRPFTELDQVIEAKAGLSLDELFQFHGEGYYRALEFACLSEVLAQPAPQVLAVGGGLVTQPAAWTLLKSRARTIWLQAPADAHLARVEAQGDLRPMAGRPEAGRQLRRLLAERSPLYAESDQRVDTERLGVQGTVDWLAERLAEHSASRDAAARPGRPPGAPKRPQLDPA